MLISKRERANTKRECVFARELQRERERGSETERQRGRETERRRDGDTERQRDRETERQRDGETERHRDREKRERKREKERERERGEKNNKKKRKKEKRERERMWHKLKQNIARTGRRNECHVIDDRFARMSLLHRQGMVMQNQRDHRRLSCVLCAVPVTTKSLPLRKFVPNCLRFILQ